MTYSLLIGQKTYSSWSLRGWLCLAPFSIPVTLQKAVIYSDTFYDDVAAFGAHRSVPAVRTPGGGMLTDSLAIAWHVAEAFPDRGTLPQGSVERAEAQSMIAEMHSGFTALRGACPMNLRTAWSDFQASDAVEADMARVQALWAKALDRSGGPFLYGAFSLADAFYAPVVTRALSYALPLSDASRDYAEAVIAHPAFTQWRDEGLAEDAEVAKYDIAGLSRIPWPAIR